MRGRRKQRRHRRPQRRRKWRAVARRQREGGGGSSGESEGGINGLSGDGSGGRWCENRDGIFFVGIPYTWTDGHQSTFESFQIQADRGCAAGAIVFGGTWHFGMGVTLRGLRISKKKEILRKLIYCKCILIDSKLCTIQYYNILQYYHMVPYCNNVKYYVKSSHQCHCYRRSHLRRCQCCLCRRCRHRSLSPLSSPLSLSPVSVVAAQQWRRSDGQRRWRRSDGDGGAATAMGRCRPRQRHRPSPPLPYNDCAPPVPSSPRSGSRPRCSPPSPVLRRNRRHSRLPPLPSPPSLFDCCVNRPPPDVCI